MALTKRTPCVGICSTTYGDLVCRGCKRFAHEIVQWNGYDTTQQATVWQRLHGLRDEVVTTHLVIEDDERFIDACRMWLPEPVFDGLASAEPAAQSNSPHAIYELMRHLVAANKPLRQGGLKANLAAAEVSALEVLQAIDAEMYARSLAHYERNYKIPV